jgi:hypothetical protein
MNAAEAAQDKLERDEGTRDRKALEAAYRAERAAIIEANRQQVQKVKRETDQSLIHEAIAWAEERRAGSAAMRKQERSQVQEHKRRNKQELIDEALAKKEKVLETRQGVKSAQEKLLHKKKGHAAKVCTCAQGSVDESPRGDNEGPLSTSTIRKTPRAPISLPLLSQPCVLTCLLCRFASLVQERANDYLVEQEKIRTLAEKKQQHQAVYAKKYASQSMAQSWAGASTLRRGGPKRDGSPGSPS